MEAEPPQRRAATYAKHMKQKRKAYHDGALLCPASSSSTTPVTPSSPGSSVPARRSPRGPRSPSRPTSSTSASLRKVPPEWSTLYTAQLTQKAKKDHNGSVRLVQAGPHVKQIVLLDDDRQVLGSRHLKPGESIESGKKCHFPNYLIEICEDKNQNKGQFVHSLVMECLIYTTQLTQKAKKYHDGIIRLMQIGSHARQIVLLDEYGEVLGDRYLKSVESVESGTKCQLPNYLIEVCELRNQTNVLPDLQRGKSDRNVNRGANYGELTFGIVDDPLKFNDIQRGSATYSLPEYGKSTSSRVVDPLQFHDLQDGKSGFSDSFIRRESDFPLYPTVDDGVAEWSSRRSAAFEGHDLAMFDIPASDMSNAQEQKLDSSSQHTGSSSGTESYFTKHKERYSEWEILWPHVYIYIHSDV
ncbi:hypothetical protein BAE44_0011970 [Dichanthelium oligosanthes]|uniref:5'-3' DNA helicase ZGRF1-like N-terminal domain-containing protein n=1 Tax=Dichanthelium oligosanthes TaxID=888268 RepID=A0A1E5VPH0_9POAL|nr:hypothetical protein BAE44_0011970 [Dichanthelium oligosanthes]